ncbi:LuxR C-terminal-related transcriptional regulator [Streptomyces sp. NRRL B-1347]|uniref:LuxR C-terminal-related transcriptional regulator n=1 Tax=Streptomyces sp. NRRL B-1347 TaxID=1476877 RepID=UPI0004C69FD0|nr:LuxR C-terminal-related transcriptional regulator [Streptomyces sp. NRRL B-1347]
MRRLLEHAASEPGVVARGTPTAEIASGLCVSAHTVRDHLKSLFAKTRVSSRGELVARLFTEHYWPALPEPVEDQRAAAGRRVRVR